MGFLDVELNKSATAQRVRDISNHLEGKIAIDPSSQIIILGPGKNAVEIQALLEMGFTKEQLIAIDLDPEAISASARFGIKTKAADIMAMGVADLDNLPRPVTIIALRTSVAIAKSSIWRLS